MDTEPWNRLVNPTAQTTTSGSSWNVVTNENYNSYVCVAIMDAFGDSSSSTTSVIARKMSDDYGVDTVSHVAKADTFNKTKFPDEEANTISGAKLFSALTLDQKVGWVFG
jgi:hypothetical protein